MLAKFGVCRAIGQQCPFCGRKNTLEFAHRGRYLSVECAVTRGGCGARGPECRKHGDAVARWNKRHAEGNSNTGSPAGDVVSGQDQFTGNDQQETGCRNMEAM